MNKWRITSITSAVLLASVILAFMIYWIVGRTGNIPWHKCIVPYIIDSSFTSSEKEIITNAMSIITSASNGIKFVEKQDHIEFIEIRLTNDESCGDSKIAKQLGGQFIGINRHCVNTQTMLHEILHALGFSHEHARPDRDKYVKIKYENIVDGMNYNFDIVQNVVWDSITSKTDYDYDSIMHYSTSAYSKNEHPTIEVVDASIDTQRLGRQQGLSKLDIQRLQKYYELFK